MSLSWCCAKKTGLFITLIVCLAGVQLVTYADNATYTYDEFGRLKSVYTDAHQIVYTYDDAGNRTAVDVTTGGLSTSIDLGVTLTGVPSGSQMVYNDVTQTVAVTNFGGIAAPNVSVTITPDATMTLISTTPDTGWSCSGTSTVTCDLTSLAADSSSNIALVLRPTAAGGITTTASATTTGTDIQTANNDDSLSMSIFESADPNDTDGDGMPDAWETEHGLDPLDGSDGSLDPDGDNLTNVEEYPLGTDPNNADTDGDGENDDVDDNPTFNPAWLVPILHQMMN